jgi:hypothetical protein
MQKRLDIADSGEPRPSQVLRRSRSGRLLSGGSDRAPSVDRRDRPVAIPIVRSGDVPSMEAIVSRERAYRAE